MSMSSTSDIPSVGSIHEEYDSKSENSTPRRKRKSPGGQPSFDSLPVDIQEEIECLYEFVPEVEQHFVVLNKIGEGTFSSVFLAKMKHYPDLDELFALKHIIPTSHPSRIEGELRCLQEIGGQDNVMGVELCIRNKDHVVIVMPYFPHEKFQDYILKMRLSEVRDYMRNMLIALRRVHMFDIIHRDVKPSNFLCDRKTKRYALVDFGLAHKAPVLQRDETKTGGKGKSSLSLSPNKKNILGVSQQNMNNSQEGNRLSLSPLDVMDSKSKDGKTRQYTPPTPDIANKVFAKRVKSPRRLLLAKRALMVKERETTHQGTKLSSVALKGNPGLVTCNCYGQPIVCTICTARSNQQAPRAGTPGFRAPEVLMKCPDQSTAVDIWSAGVIFLSLLSGRYPFFRANDDFTALAQIISILGSEEVKESAKTYGKTLICSPATLPVDLKTLCNKLRSGTSTKTCRSNPKEIDSDKENIINASWAHVPNSAYDLLNRLLNLNPMSRITAEKALDHPFFTDELL